PGNFRVTQGEKGPVRHETGDPVADLGRCHGRSAHRAGRGPRSGGAAVRRRLERAGRALRPVCPPGFPALLAHPAGTDRVVGDHARHVRVVRRAPALPLRAPGARMAAGDQHPARHPEGRAMTEAEIFEYCRTTVRAYLRKRVPNVSDLDDCVSEVVVRALEGIRKGQQPVVLEAWLNGIAANVLKERYRAKYRDGDMPGEVAQEVSEQQLELGRTDLPDLPSELEVVLGKRQLWATLGAATRGLGDGLASIMLTHMRLTVERGRHVVGAELAKELGQPVDTVNRQLQRSRVRMHDAIAALVLARTGRAECAGLRTVLGAEQLLASRRLVLGPDQTRAVLKHAAGC